MNEMTSKTQRTIDLSGPPREMKFSDLKDGEIVFAIVNGVGNYYRVEKGGLTQFDGNREQRRKLKKGKKL